MAITVGLYNFSNICFCTSLIVYVYFTTELLNLLFLYEHNLVNLCFLVLYGLLSKILINEYILY